MLPYFGPSGDAAVLEPKGTHPPNDEIGDPHGQEADDKESSQGLVDTDNTIAMGAVDDTCNGCHNFKLNAECEMC